MRTKLGATGNQVIKLVVKDGFRVLCVAQDQGALCLEPRPVNSLKMTIKPKSAKLNITSAVFAISVDK